MAIPEGYRLLTVDDVGKTFGTDLEQIIYFDTTANMSYFKSYALTWVGGVLKGPQAGQLTIVFDDVLVWDFRYASVPSPYWIYDNYTVPSGTTIESVISNFTWNTFLYVKDIEEEASDPKTQFITDMNGLADSINEKAGTTGKKTIKEMKSLVDGLKTEFVTQEKTVTPTKSSQTITPDSGKDGLSKVTVEAIPDEYIVPSGSLEITENGTHDVTDKESVNVNVPVPVIVQWDGAYEEIVSGFTLTLDCATAILNNATYTYSLDGGQTYNQFTNPATGTSIITLENVSQIMFKQGNTYFDWYIGTTSGGHDIAGLYGSGESENIKVEADATWYLSLVGGGSGD